MSPFTLPAAPSRPEEPPPASDTHTQGGLLDSRQAVWLQESSQPLGVLVSLGHPAGKEWVKDQPLWEARQETI